MGDPPNVMVEDGWWVTGRRHAGYNKCTDSPTSELYDAFYDAGEDTSIGVVLLSAEGPSSKDGIYSFCSGGDQRIRGKDGYQYTQESGQVDPAKLGRLHILEVQRLIRFMPKAVIAVVPGWAVGGGHSLHVVCDLTLASKEHAIFNVTNGLFFFILEKKPL